jgi:hypothetical protein
MLILGGTFPNSTQCDSPVTYGFHNLDLTENNADNAKWIGFNDSKQGYQVPPEVIAEIGGSQTGGATDREPEAGFNNPDLTVLFTRVYSAASTRTPTRVIPLSTSTSAPSSHKLSTGAIIGIGVGGGIVAVLLCTAAVCLCFKKSKRSKQVGAQPAELPGSFKPSPGQSNSQAYSPGHSPYGSAGYDPNYPYGASPHSAYGSYPPAHNPIYQLPAGEGEYLSPLPSVPPVELGSHEVISSRTPVTATTMSEKTDPSAGSYGGFVHHTPSPSVGSLGALRHSTSPQQPGYFPHHQSLDSNPPQPVYVENSGQQPVYYPPPQGSGQRSPTTSDRYDASPLPH